MEPTKISSSQGTQPAQAARSRSTAQAPDAKAPGAGGFLALLAALGEGPEGGGGGAPLDLTASVAVTADPGFTDASKGAMDASTMAAWQGLLAPGADVKLEPAAVENLQQGGIVRAGLQSGSPLNAGVSGAGVQSGLPSMAGNLSTVDGLPQGMVAETTMLDSLGGRQEALPQVGGTPHGRAFTRTQSLLAQKADAMDVSVGRSTLGGTALQSPGHLAASLAAVQAAGDRMLASAPTAGALDRSTGGVVDPTAGGSVVAPLGADLLSPVSSARGEGANGGRGRSGEGDSGAWFDSGGGSAPVESASMDGGAVFADPAQAGSEEQVAEQVAYWVNQKTQNAELTLTRDGQPVEVSVSLSGNEAHVTFRSDQAQTRELLDRSMAQLSALLLSEGLVLSGMSVGTSAGQREDADGSQRQGQRDSARQAKVVAAAPAGTASQLRGSVSDRAVDVFV